MKRIALLLLLAAAATPAAAQSSLDAQAAARSADLQAWGARYDAQAAEAARAQAEARYRIRSIEVERNSRARITYVPADPTLVERIDLESAERQSADASRREFDARMREMNAWLDAARPR